MSQRGGATAGWRTQVLLGGGVALAARSVMLPGGPQRWERTNHRGRTVSLRSGPALALAAAAGSAGGSAPLVVGLGAGLLGAYDDVAGARQAQQGAKGLRGHLRALRQGRVTAGVVKAVGLAVVGAAGAALLGPGREAADPPEPAGRPGPAQSPGRPGPSGSRGRPGPPRAAPGARGEVALPDVLLGAGLVAGAANLLNLLDLRPGRALKAGLAGAVAVRRPGVVAAVVVLLPDDLAERTMLGDAGANALGAVLGLALADRLAGRRSRAAALGLLAALTAASEVVSFSRVIDAVPVLRALDRLGRAP